MRPSLLLTLSALTSCLVREVTAAPLAPTDTWSSFSTFLVQPVKLGARELVVHDCSHVRVGARVRLSFGSEEEEEGSVASVECNSQRLATPPAALALAAAPECAYAASQADGTPPQLSAKCREMMQAALRVPGLAQSYREASKAASSTHAAALAADMANNANALLPATLEEGGVRGVRLLQGEGGGARTAGVVTLAAGVLFDHSANVTLRGTEPLSEAETVPTCPESDGVACGGHGACDSSSSSCTCDAGWRGAACEASACDSSCGEHGQCQSDGRCSCQNGWAGATCAEAACASDCSGRGSCVNGQCSCRAGFHGATCSVHTLDACPSGCNGHGNCAVVGAGEPVCLCHAKFLGTSCLQSVNECPGSCSDHGSCENSAVTGQPECACYPGYSGDDCSLYCPHNCTVVPTAVPLDTPVAQGRCSASLLEGSSTELQCICKEGYSGPDCSQVCPSRCNGHGDCVNGMCECRAGYDGVECATLAPRYLGIVFLEGIQGFHPVMLPTFIALSALLCFCCVGYTFNRWHGRFGTSAVPMWDYYAKRWRNAPLFEPIFAVPAATQTPAPHKEDKGR